MQPDGSRFVDVTRESGTGNTGWTLAVTASNYDGDGRIDIGVANDFGRKCLYRNNGNGTFTETAKHASTRLQRGHGAGIR